MADIVIQQAIYSNAQGGGFRFVARSPGFDGAWPAEAERLCVGFGERPPGVACPAAVFARPFARQQVAVVQVADLGCDDAGRPGALGFRLLIVPRDVYRQVLHGDPFRLAEQFPPPWEARGELPALTLPPEPAPPRQVETLQRVLQHGDAPTLLGGAQALVDGGRLVFQRSAPDLELVRSLWLLLPTANRCELWPASFAFGNALGFDVLVLPRVNGELAGYLSEQHAGEYPEGRYELALQIAVEAGDQRELDALLQRRSSRQTLKLALVLLVMMSALAVFMKSSEPPPRPEPETAAKAGSADNGTRLDLPPPDDFPDLNEPERERLTAALRGLAVRLGIDPPPEAAEELLAAIDRKLGTPPTWRFGPIETGQPIERQLRILLKKHGVADYNRLQLNPVELVVRLEQKVAPREAPPRQPRRRGARLNPAAGVGFAVSPATRETYLSCSRAVSVSLR
jgi:hypothetical protein